MIIEIGLWMLLYLAIGAVLTGVTEALDPLEDSKPEVLSKGETWGIIICIWPLVLVFVVVATLFKVARGITKGYIRKDKE